MRPLLVLVGANDDADDVAEFIGDKADEDLCDDVGVSFLECGPVSSRASSCSSLLSELLLNTFDNKVIGF